MKRFHNSIAIILAGLIISGSTWSAATEQYLKRGQQYWQDKKVGQAESQFKLAVQADPRSVKARKQLADFYLSQRNSDKAITEFEEAILLDPENGELFVGMAIAHLHKGNRDIAIIMLERALQLNPELEYAESLKKLVEAKKAQAVKEKSQDPEHTFPEMTPHK